VVRKLAVGTRSPKAAPYLSNYGGPAGERVLPPGPALSDEICRALPDDLDALRRLAEVYLANSSELVACHDPSGRVTWASERARDVMGRPVSHLLGRDLEHWVAPEDRAQVRSAVGRLQAHGDTAACTYRIRLRNGRRRWVETRWRAVAGDDGKLRELQSATRAASPATAPGPANSSDRRAFQRLRDLAAHLESVREEERSTIAREIHDDLGHQLTTLGFELGSLAREVEPVQAELGARLGQMRGICGDILGSLRRIVTQLRPAVLDGFGLAAAIEWQAGEFARHTGIATRVDADDVDLDIASAANVFRIFQEALTNVARHSGAQSVAVSLRRSKRGLELLVSDDGRGFEPRTSDATSFGLLGMRERALALAGQLLIDSRPGRGTTIRLRMPDRRRVGQSPTPGPSPPTSDLGSA
jgi:two-component system sensor histidine kinase UhpB